MSFLHRAPSPSPTPTPPAQTHTPPPTAIERNESFLDRLHDTFHPSHQAAPLTPTLPPPVTQPQTHTRPHDKETHQDDSLLDKLTSKLSLSSADPTPPPPPPAPPAPPAHTASSSSGFLHRLADKLESTGDREAAAAIPVAPAPPRAPDGSIWDGLGFVAVGNKTPPPPPPPKGTLERLQDKVKDAVGGERKGAVPDSRHGESLLDKLDELAGGGVKGEEREDALDKTIDWVQKVMGSTTDQSDESAAEQAKDGVIAEQLRSQWERMTGQPFPVKRKEH